MRDPHWVFSDGTESWGVKLDMLRSYRWSVINKNIVSYLVQEHQTLQEIFQMFPSGRFDWKKISCEKGVLSIKLTYYE